MRVHFGDCVLDTDTRQLFVAGSEVHLQPKAFQFLDLLIRNRPRVVPKEEIHDELWPGTFVSDGTLTSLLAEVRDAIQDDARHPRFVRTSHRVGYAFFGTIEREQPSGPKVARPERVVWLVRGKSRVTLEPGETIIGRDPALVVCVDDPSVSRRHARIVVSAGNATLEDLGSKNGTFLGDQRISGTTSLSDGVTIRVGSVPFVVRVYRRPETTVTST